jgi:hypothetical protein
MRTRKTSPGDTPGGTIAVRTPRSGADGRDGGGGGGGVPPPVICDEMVDACGDSNVAATTAMTAMCDKRG